MNLGIPLLMSESFWNVLSNIPKNSSRLCDRVMAGPHEPPTSLYTYDMDLKLIGHGAKFGGGRGGKGGRGRGGRGGRGLMAGRGISLTRGVSRRMNESQSSSKIQSTDVKEIYF